ncbi:hypothetical protein BDU57DRAFT_120043 [Ampelomyces quisqualis]|uniref:Uncharacterized protein n=1 Tax=Ampelomyces quisqualis TaxID=50730 RepID=A0A6A5QTQ5_AMPQU|nr:hypothetical protein BDU57DRAFT_120043 [Ampelomyces quisqualis]
MPRRRHRRIKRSLPAAPEGAIHYYSSPVIRAQFLLGHKTGSTSENYLHTTFKLFCTSHSYLASTMPSLPFNTTPSSSPAPSPTLSPTPAIVLHSPASGIFDQPHLRFASNLKAGSAPPKSLHKSRQDAAELYRLKMAKYFAATFNMSMTAALAEADSQLAPRRSSNFSEAESFRVI